MRSRLGYALLALLFITLACSLAGPAATPPPTETQTPPALSTDTPLPPTEPSPPTETLTSTPVDPRCVTTGDTPVLEAAEFAYYPDEILAFLNAGGSPEALDAALYEAGIANQPLAVAPADFTGDGKEGVAVSIYDPQSETLPPEGVLLVYICQSGEFQLAHQWVSENWGAPGIRYAQDLNADRAIELVAGSANCGAHTCFEDIQVLLWDENGFENRLEGTSKDLPYPDFRLEDPDGDGIFDIVGVGSGFGSVGAGPQRNLTRRWGYHPETGSWQADEEQGGPSNYRIHVLHDADRAALAGEWDQALLLYGRVVQDATLQEWMDPEQERANLAAYALFKTGVVYLLQEQAGFAQTTFEQLEREHPAGSPGHAYTELSAAFQEGYAPGGVPAGCAEAQAYASQNEAEILEPLGSATYGYANPDYTPEDICPWD